MEKVRPWCGQPSDRGRLKNRNIHAEEKPNIKSLENGQACHTLTSDNSVKNKTVQECVVEIDTCRLERKRIEEPQQTHHLHFADRADVVDVNINKDFERHAY